MTMIAYSPGKMPLLVGDLLITDRNRLDDVRIPTHSENLMDTFSLGSAFHPTKLHQKIYTFKHNVCGAFAGSLSEIKNVLPDLYLFCRYHDEIDSVKLSSYIKERCQEIDTNELAFVLWILEKEGDQIATATLHFGNWFKGNSPLLGEMNAAGSGAIDFLKAVSATVSIDAPKGIFSNYQTVTAGYILFVAQLMAHEKATLSTVKKHWGAGFELVFPHEGSFKKLDDITYVINHGKFDSAGKLDGPAPLTIMNYKYHGENLVITSISIVQGQVDRTEEDFLTFRDKDKNYTIQQFIVEPLYQDGEGNTAAPSLDPSFVSDIVAMAYLFENEEKEYYMPVGLHRGSDVRIEYHHEQGFSIAVNKASREILLANVKKHMSEKEPNC